MEKELKDYLDQNFSKLATKEEVNSIKGKANGLKNELKALEERVLHQYHITAEAMGRPIFSGEIDPMAEM